LYYAHSVTTPLERNGRIGYTTQVKLKRLEVDSLAIIDRLELDLGPGLNVFTGETGAGKSIVMDALSLLLGARGSSEMIRTGAKHLLVLAYWDDETTSSRRIVQNGKSTARLEGEVVSVRELAGAVAAKVTIHGQHGAVALLDSKSHREYLDSALPQNQSQGPLIRDYHTAYSQYAELHTRLERLKLSERERARQLDVLDYQWGEIDKIKPQIGEEATLLAEIERLSHLQDISAAAGEALERIQEGEVNALELLHEAVKSLSSAAKHDPALESLRLNLREIQDTLKGISSELRSTAEDNAFEPSTLERLEKRMAQIHKLESKYGSSIAEVLDYQRELAQKIDELRGDDHDLETLERTLQQQYTQVIQAGELLSKARNQAAGQLSHKLERVIHKLGMPHAKLSFKLTPLEQPAPHGLESVELLFGANKGEAMGSLSSVASGGELSRVMLALSTVLGSQTPTVVFDEVDAGIGGSAASAVAEELAALAKTHQILLVTHLAQIAAKADQHFLVSKHITPEGRTESKVRALNQAEKVEELARMLSGSRSSAALEHARELLKL
jgi:DNA repair protein RecN (Recombination protein N)